TKTGDKNMGGKLSSDILRGHTDTIVLASLLDRDRYGFEIYNRVLNKTDNLYELKETTLYSSYKRLEKDGFIQSYWGDETQGGRRKYYRITVLGRELYQQKLKDYEFTKKILERLFMEERLRNRKNIIIMYRKNMKNQHNNDDSMK